MEDHWYFKLKFNQLCDAGYIEGVQAAIDNGADVNATNYLIILVKQDSCGP